MTSWHSYPSIYALGHAAVGTLFDDVVLIEEKVDGSQFSFGRFDGVLRVRSKGKEMLAEAPESMFAKAVAEVAALPLHDGWTYRGEMLNKPKHNSLAYTRTPAHNVIIYDINTDEEQYLAPDAKAAEAARLGLEVVPMLYHGRVADKAIINDMLARESILGGQKIEGVVVKSYTQFGRDKKVLMGKYVSEAFKEVHAREWKQSNPQQGDIISQLITQYRTDARWAKAVQHLRDDGALTGTPADIGKLIAAVKQDIKSDSTEAIKDYLYKWAIDQILRGTTAGVAEWYKQQLLEVQFNG